MSPIIQNIIRPVVRRILPPYFVPVDLFNLGQQGVWYDISDKATLFQDAAGTVPVTAVDQPVGRVLDKSGNNNHAFTPDVSATSRPLFKVDETGRSYLLFDGSNDLMVTNSINFTATDKMSAVIGLRKLSDAARGMIIELSATVANTGAFAIDIVPPAYRIFGVSNSGSASSLLTVTAPSSRVVTGQWSGNAISLRENGVLGVAGNQVSAKFGNYPLYIGRRGGATLPLNGRLYGLIVCGAALTNQQITETENWMAQKTGVII